MLAVLCEYASHTLRLLRMWQRSFNSKMWGPLSLACEYVILSFKLQQVWLFPPQFHNRRGWTVYRSTQIRVLASYSEIRIVTSEQEWVADAQS
jgi:hypothetical protein